jgi:esterase/lipase
MAKNSNLREMFLRHDREDKDFQKEIEKNVKEINDLLSNHFVDFKESITQVKTDVDWLKRSHWMVKGSMASAVGAMVVSLLNFFLK